MDIKQYFHKIDELNKALKKLQPLKAADEQRLWKKFRLEWNYNSNHIEGNTLTYSHTELLIIFDQVAADYTGREIEEMKAHDVAVKMVVDLANDNERDLNENFIRQLNEIILVRPFYKEAVTPDGQPTRKLIQPGEYKTTPNSVRLQNGEIFNYASPEETPAQMGDLIGFYRTNSASTEVHPLWLAAMIHYKFVLIHPFDDGNGRIARLIMNYILLKKRLPPAIIRSSDKKGYLTALNKADTGDLESFVIYTGEQLVWSLEISIKAAKGESVDEKGDLDKKLLLMEKELEAIDPNEEIKKQFSKEVFFEIYDSWLTELMKGIIPAIQKFNKFFTGSRHWINIQNGIGGLSFVDESAHQILENLRIESMKGKDRISSHDTRMSLQTSYGSFTKGGLNSFGCNYGFEIKFDLTKYEVWVDEFSETKERKQVKLYERLLHKSLNEAEINTVVTKLSETIYDHIDFHTKKSGLR